MTDGWKKRIKSAWRTLMGVEITPKGQEALRADPLSLEERNKILTAIMNDINRNRIIIPRGRMVFKELKKCKTCPALSSHLNRQGQCYDCVEKLLLPIDTALGWAPKQHE